MKNKRTKLQILNNAGINTNGYDLDMWCEWDESGANGIWDLAGDIARNMLGDWDHENVESLQELLYNLIRY